MPPRCGSAPPRPRPSCAASPARTPSTRPTRRWWSSGRRSRRFSCMLLGSSLRPPLPAAGGSMADATSLQQRWPVLAAVPQALAWLRLRVDLGLAPRTLDAYARGLSEYLAFSAASGADPLAAGREHLARFVRHLLDRPSRHVGAGAAPGSPSSSCPRLSNAAVQQRLTAVRLFYDHVVEEGLRDSNPVGRGRYAPHARPGSNRRGLIPRETRLPWIPDEAEWRAVLDVA